MKKKYLLIAIAAFLTCLTLFVWSSKKKNKTAFPTMVNLALRDVGDKLLRAQHDTISVVLPIVEKENSRFILSFEAPLSVNPDTLVYITQQSFQKAKLPNNYILELLTCSNEKVAYSYAMQENTNEAIVPCKGRVLPKSCYFIVVQFNELVNTNNIVSPWYYAFFFMTILLVVLVIKNKSSKNTSKIAITENYTTVGSFHFYPEQNKLVQQSKEIALSKKECELLAIFIAQPNKVIKREELSKKVWEDQGVIVGRSLDTYISKLRKKLKPDANIKLTNVHGVGYKLEIL